MKSYQPLETKERLQVADALRGMALFGIMLANIPYLDETEKIYRSRHFVFASPISDHTLSFLLHLLIDKKFITIFSILFGFGFYMQMRRAEEKLVNFKSYFLWRMTFLLIIGCLHAYLLWFGDIIRDYAICGMFLLLVYRWPSKRIFVAAIIFNVLLTGLVYVGTAALGLNNYSYDTSIARELPITNSYWRYLEISARIDPFVNFVHDSPLTLVFCFGNMLLGFWMAKSGFFHNPEKFSKTMQRLIIAGLTVGIGSSYLFNLITSGMLELTTALIWLPFVILCGMILQSLFYISAFVKLFQLSRWKKFLSLFAPVGKMALTNYLMQTILYLFIFFHSTNAFSLYGEITITETFLIAAVLFAFQVACSTWWLKNHQQGPIEFLWKRGSYLFYKKKVDGSTQ